MTSMSSTLSQRTLARLTFFTSPSWPAVKACSPLFSYQNLQSVLQQVQGPWQPLPPVRALDPLELVAHQAEEGRAQDPLGATIET